MSETHPTGPQPAGTDLRSVYWRSIDELRFTPEYEQFLHREFPLAATEVPEGVSRRRWMQLMGASVALATAAGCRWEAEQFLPSSGSVPDYVPGEPEFYATCDELRGGFARALLVRKFDGRPVKVEGNPDHPQSRVKYGDLAHGASDAFAQARILDLYDPDRLGRPRQTVDGKPALRNWDQVERSIRDLVSKAGDGGSVRILAAASASPSRERMEKSLAERLGGLGWVEYEPLPWESPGQGAAAAFGQRARPHYRFEAADVMLVLDGDPLGGHPDQIRHANGWASRRDPKNGTMNRLYVAESQYSHTGTAADHRRAVPSSRMPQFLDELEAALDGEKAGNEFVRAVAADLNASKGKGLIYVGPRQPAAVHARVHRLNARLGNVGAGKPVVLTEEPRPERPPVAEAIAKLADEMRAGTVKTLVILRGNPVYDAPADVKFADALAKVPNTVHLSEYENETSRACGWYLPATHPFEEWGDGRTYDGTYTLRQPMIDPLHGGKSDVELLAILLGDGPKRGEQIVRATYDATAGGGDVAWQQAIHDGFVPGTALPPIDAQPTAAGADEGGADRPAGDELEVVFCESEQLYDGRFANNGWLQETPHVLTKVTWDNVALVSFEDADKQGVANEDLVELTFDGRTITLPAYLMPGQAVGSIGIALGFGRTAAGLVGGFTVEGAPHQVDPVGVDVYALRTTRSMAFGRGATIKSTGETKKLATTQDHWQIDRLGQKEIEERIPLLVREATPELLAKHPDFIEHAVHHPPLTSLWHTPEMDRGYAWGMTIDLTKCIGCNACSVACQSENNVPIVGREQVLRGREMHWLRIDRYFRGEPSDPVVVTQPVFCMHCEHAPCEEVCPVAATVHDHEGLNVMIYNRCVGTRYCSNNCPYKVRRFNFFNWEKQAVNAKYRGETTRPEAAGEKFREANRALADMVRNPEVTVRSRGVMEKCTYCTQRIQAAKIEVRNEQTRDASRENEAVRTSSPRIADGTIKTACQQVCPTGALVFGDYNDANSRISQDKTNKRSYPMLAELNTRPRTWYMARMRNPHAGLEEAYSIPPIGHASDAHHSPGEGHEHDHDRPKTTHGGGVEG